MDREPSVNIIILGTWNSKLFSPNWLVKNIFRVENNNDFKIAFDMEELDATYQFKNIYLLPRRNLIEIKVLKNTEDTFKTAIEVYNKIINLFKHVTIKGIGINFKYQFSTSVNKRTLLSESLLNLHQEFNGELINNFSLKYPKNDYMLNIASSLNNVDVHDISFNYHYPNSCTLEEGKLNNLYVESLKYIENGNFDD